MVMHAGCAYPLREGKGTALEGGQREPCIIRYPNKIKPGRVINVPMMAIDMLPTIAEITGSKLPDNKIDGMSVWDIWTGKSNQSPHEGILLLLPCKRTTWHKIWQVEVVFPT